MPIHESESPASSTAKRKMPNQSKGPVAPIESKNISNILEGMKIEEANLTKVKAMNSPPPKK